MATDTAQRLLIEIVAAAAGVKPETIGPQTNLNEDLGLDSLEFVELMQEISEKVKAVPKEEWAKLDTVADLLKACE